MASWTCEKEKESIFGLIFKDVCQDIRPFLPFWFIQI